MRAGDRLDRQQVDADDGARAALQRHLGPATGSGAEVEHAHALLDDVEAIVEFDELKGGARPPAVLLRRRDIGVVELARQPALRGDAAPGRFLKLDRKTSSGALAGIRCALTHDLTPSG
jgi:hypothetical protein